MSRAALQVNTMPLRSLMIVSLLVYGGTQSQAAPPPVQPAPGKRVDDSRSYLEATPPSSEGSWNPAYPAGSSAPGVATPRVPGDLPFRITVDGEPLPGDALSPEADRQRAVDVALAKADIQIRFDPGQARPSLNVWSHPDGTERGEMVEFGAYTNYAVWIAKAEIRIFAGRQAKGQPLAVVPARWDGMATWLPPAAAPGELVFLLRVYDRKGRFDETAVKPLRLLDKGRPHSDLEAQARERLVGWGLDSRTLANIPVAGGTVTVNGKGLQAGQRIETLGTWAPVDRNGAFAVRQILPPGPHRVTVAVIEPDGRKATFARNLTLPDQSWFYVAIADLTVGRNHASGPAALVTADSQHYDGRTYFDGRAAFYLKGLIQGKYLLTASADTTEQPVEDLFRNFSSKDPHYLLKRIDPERFYPVYGDDSTAYEDAPTRGKFYVRLERGDSHVLWGNFQTQWTGTELTQYSRGLYGAKLRLATPGTTGYGEKRAALDAFAAEPGTAQSREEFRSTGGSLYYLRHLDITQGSEQVWVEARDKDSGLVLERKQLVPAQDYEFNYLQGRLLLTAPLSSYASSGALVSGNGTSGNPVFLVTSYEYTPGTSALSTYSHGVQGNWWINDYVRVGLTGFRQGGSDQGQKLEGADLILRATPGTYLKAEVARSEGAGTGQQNSIDGGFDFSSSGVVGERAEARRVEIQAEHGDLGKDWKGTTRLYVQDREKGFSGPGQLTPGEADTRFGGRTSLPLGETVDLDLKADKRQSDSQEAENLEGNLLWRIAPPWEVGLGVRNDSRRTDTPSASTELSQNGSRTDIQGRLHYLPQIEGPGGQKVPGPWDLYGFLQGTANRTGDRVRNDRAGLGGSWQATDRFRLSAEASGGDGGPAGLLGGDYRVNDRSNVYLKYQMETERPDENRSGRYSTAITGTHYRVNDQVSVFGETKATQGAGAESLVHAFGLDIAPNDRWTYGIKADWGTVSDASAGDLQREGLGFSVGYKRDKITYGGNVEYRHEDGDSGHRIVWLARNALSYQASEDWRWFGKANFSVSTNTRGAFYDGNYVELVSGAAYRPVLNDRWNTLVKYTFLKDTPTAGQVTDANQTADYVQRSHVFAVDTIHDLRPWLSLGGKLGYRLSELKPSKTSGDWFHSEAVLGVVRADLHFVRKWDWLGEYRVLKATEAQDTRSGFLTALYYHVDKHVKVGVGYNFTDFSDDLTDLSYRSRGVFLNIIGKM